MPSTGHPTVVLLHGLAGSAKYWRGMTAMNATVSMVSIDLAGFGDAIDAPGPYGIVGQRERLRAYLRARCPDGAILVGHSYGALVALAVAASSSSVRGVVGFNVPAFSSAAEARRHIAREGAIQRWMVEDPQKAWAMCQLMCATRGLAAELAPMLAPDLPVEVAKDGVQHMWPALHESFADIVAPAPVRSWVDVCPSPICLVMGTDDEVAPPRVVQRALLGSVCELLVEQGRHHLPLEQPQRALDHIARMVERTSGHALSLRD